MSDADFGTDTADDNSQTPKAIREYAEKMKKQNDELQAQIAKFQAKERRATIADTLREAQVDPKLARFVERDLEGDVTAEAVNGWLQENGSLFGLSPTETPDGEVAAAAAAVSALASTAPTGQAAWTPERIATASYDELVTAGILPPLR